MTTDQKQKQDETPEERPPFQQRFLAGLKEFGIILGLFLLINNFVIASFLVPTGSMENEVLTGELLFVNKFIYGGTSPRNLQQFDVLSLMTGGSIKLPHVPLPWFRVPAFRDVERGDVIVFVFPGMRDEVEQTEFVFYLKRCIGLAGDTVEIRDRVVHVNGQMAPIPRNIRFDSRYSLTPDRVDERIFPRGAPWNEDHFGPLVVPFRGMTIPLTWENLPMWDVFIRREGHVPRLVNGEVHIDGQPASAYTVEQNYMYGMGDHRDNSLDGRYWGFIPEENIVGTPMFVYWSWNTDIPLISGFFDRLGSIRWGRIFSAIR